MELLLIVAILGILASLGIPRLTGVNQKAQDTSISVVAGSIKTAMEIYFIDNGNSYPDAAAMSNTTGYQAWNELFGRSGLLEGVDLTVSDLNELIENYNIKAFEYSNPGGLQSYRMSFTSNSSDKIYILTESSFN